MSIRILLLLLSATLFTVGHSEFSEETFFDAFQQVLSERIASYNEINVDQKSTLLSQRYDNQTCTLHLQRLLDGILSFDLWAVELVDSWGKIPSGILQGNLRSFGNFDQCLDIHNETDLDTAGILKGQYCTASLVFPGQSMVDTVINMDIIKSTINFKNNVEFRIGGAGDFGLPITAGICIPNSCSPEYFSELINSVTGSSLMPINVNVHTSDCQEKTDPDYNALAIAAICFFGLIACLLVLSTIYDVVMTNRNAHRNSNLIAFSMYTNGEKIFRCTKSSSPDVLNCLNGIRVLSISWVVFCHTYKTSELAIVNILTALDWFQEYTSQLVLSATVSVDTFFLLSGLLVCCKGRLNIFLLYFHRYLRLTPTLAAAIFFYVAIFPLFINGPMNSPFFYEYCENYWWTTLLYVQNFVNVNEMCFNHSWYLAIDMQLFILSPIFIYPLWRWKRKFLPFLILPIFLAIICTFSIMMIYQLRASMTDAGMIRMEKIYYKTYTRMGVWFVGVILGFILHNLRVKGQKIKIAKIWIGFGWLISLGIIFAVIFGMHDINQWSNETTTFQNALYEGYARVSWSFGIAWIIFACVEGYGGPIDWLLSLPQWQPLARLSYSIYILHAQIQIGFLQGTRTNEYFSDINMIHRFWGHFGITCTVALFWTMAFESPILVLEKLLLSSGGSSKNKKGKLRQEHDIQQHTNENLPTLRPENENNGYRNPSLIAFSMYTNGEKIFKCTRSSSPDVLNCLNGIRVLSIVWVVFCHTYTTSGFNSVNLLVAPKWLKEYSSQLVTSATVAVDSFFLLSGLLVCWSMLRHLDKTKGRLNVLLLYFHRYLRLTPTLAAAIFFFLAIFPLFITGPSVSQITYEYCQKNWWSTLLYVQNYLHVNEMCFAHSWYLAIDMQLFILSPIFIYPLWRWKRSFLPFLVLPIFLATMCTFTIMMIYQLSASMTDVTGPLIRMGKIYHKTHTRMGVWFVGVILGYILHSLKGQKIKIAKIWVGLGWIIFLATILAVVFGMHDINQLPNKTTVLENALYDAYARVSWAVGLAWIIFACVHGYGGPIDWFLSLPQWQPLARLSYSIYILHMQILLAFLLISRTPGYFSDINMIHTFWGNFGITCTVALFWTMAFESPILTLEKLLLGGSTKNKKENSQRENDASQQTNEKRPTAPPVESGNNV